MSDPIPQLSLGGRYALTVKVNANSRKINYILGHLKLERVLKVYHRVKSYDGFARPGK